jgi:3-phosphoshikimate 1-carboxyvinyltransferase
VSTGSRTELRIVGARPLRGRLRLPGDKGISHRALLAAAMADGVSRLTHLAPGEDVESTRGALEALGVRIDADSDGLTVRGHGVGSLHEPAAVVDCGNSGTTMRMLAGLVAGVDFLTVLTGDASLSSRPMARVAEPLRALGAHVDARDGGRLAPLVVRGGALRGTRVELAVASGQVKTAIVLAGLQADGATEVVEPAPSRDHTERLFRALGAPVETVDDRTVRVTRGGPRAFDLDVPGDPSSAAFLVVAALVAPDSEIVLEDVLLNPGRIAFVDVLLRMGADITVTERGERLGEPVGDVRVASSALRGTSIVCAEPIIDEIPALAVAAAFAEGVTEVTNGAELRVKESDRIATLEQELTTLGVAVEAHADGLRVTGGRTRPGTFKSHGDHRVAMAAAVAANATAGASSVRGWQAVPVSYPGFADDLDTLAGGAS